MIDSRKRGLAMSSNSYGFSLFLFVPVISSLDDSKRQFMMDWFSPFYPLPLLKVHLLISTTPEKPFGPSGYSFSTTEVVGPPVTFHQHYMLSS